MINIKNKIIELMVIHRDENDAEIVLNNLRKARLPIRPKYIAGLEDLQDALSTDKWDLLLSIPATKQLNIIQICRTIAKSKQDIPVVVISPNMQTATVEKLLSTGVNSVVPDKSALALQRVVKSELRYLADRRKLAELKRLYAEACTLNKQLLATSRDAIAYVHSGMHIYANPSYMELFGYRDIDSLLEQPMLNLIAPKQQAKFKEFMRNFDEDSTPFDNQEIQTIGMTSKHKPLKLKLELCNANYDEERCLQIIIRTQDTAEYEHKIKEMARLDQLTGLFNRHYFIELLEKSLSDQTLSNTEQENHKRSAVLFISLDKLETVRAQFQLAVLHIDELTKKVAEVLKNHLSEGILARFGEGAFMLLLKEKNKDYALEVATDLCVGVKNALLEVAERSVLVTISIGIAHVLAGDASSVLANAKEACQEAENQGGNTIYVYKPKLEAHDSRVDRLNKLAKMIEPSMEEGRIFLVFQAIVNLQGSADEIYDVYLRMVDEKGNQISTWDLFTAAEKTGQNSRLDCWVVNEVARLVLMRLKQGQKVQFFIRLSDHAIEDIELLRTVRQLMTKAPVLAQYMIFQINEPSALGNLQKHTPAFLGQLKKFSCRTALEHFGSTVQPDAVLEKLPVDFVKIDGNFTKNLGNNSNNQAMIQKLVALTHRMNRQIIAEGIEDADSLGFLWQNAVDFAQGHYLQMPSKELNYDFNN